MAILEEESLVWVGGNNVRHYESLGYEIPKYLDNQGRLKIKKGTKILVKVNHLPKVSTVKVTKICDDCGKYVLNQEYGVILSRRKESDGKDHCHNCGKINGGDTRKNNTSYEKSLELWAIENDMTFLLEEFSGRNHKKPKNISYGSEDEYLWNCPKCKSEYQMKVNNRTNSHCNCPYCAGTRINETNCLWTTHPEFAKLLFNSEDGYKVTSGSGKKVKFTCPDCNYSDSKRVQDVVRQGFSCPRCSDGLSYPEKYVFSMLSQLNFKIERQKIFEWSTAIVSDNHRLNGTKKYDFYIPSLNFIIETHGEQHYDSKFTMSETSLNDEQANDELKENLAKQNNIDIYIINCSKSDPDFIRNNIKNSGLNELLCLNDIEWGKCHNYALTSLIKSTCELWEKHKNINDICKVIHLEKSTVRRYLIKGSKIGLCDYDGQEEARKTIYNNLQKIHLEKRIKIVQLTKYNEFIREWESAAEANRILGINNIPTVLNGRQKTAGGFKWMYKEGYDIVLKKIN